MRRSLGKLRCSPAWVVSLLALFVALTGVGYAATGGGLILGHTNSASRGTALRSKGGPTLALTNNGGKPAASFSVLRGKPPFAVNSSTKVKGLNADLLDGIDSSAFQRRVRNCAAGSAISEVNANGSVVCVTASALSPTWGLAGNAGTDPSADFLGTTDAEPLIIKTNNNEALRVDPEGGVGIGTTVISARLDVSDPSIAILGTSQTASGVSGTSSSGDGVDGTSTSRDGLLGMSQTGNGVGGTSTSGRGISGVSTSGTAINAVSNSGFGVNGQSTSSVGVNGGSASDVGVYGASTSDDGVGGRSSTGYGVVGDTSSGPAGVLGEGPNDGVLGMSSHASGGNTAAAVDAINTGGGDIFIGQTSAGTHVARIDSAGKGYFDGGTQTGGADYAESIRASVNTKTLSPGDVMAIDPEHPGEVRLSDGPDSQLVVGVYSTKPSVLAIGNHSITDSLAGNVPVAMLGIVPTKVSAENGPIRPGDLLTTARTPGYAMKAKPVIVSGVAIYPTGAILGKALQPLRNGRGVISVLVTLR
jgi:hypothetical protein